MKFVDPLSVMRYLGGSLPIHISMALYSAYILFEVKPSLKCWYGFKGTTKDNLFDDVWVIFAAHITCIIAQLLSKCCKSSS